MPVSFCPCPQNKIKPVPNLPSPLTNDSALKILRRLRPDKRELVDKVLQSSLVSRDAFRVGARPPSPSESGAGTARENAFNPKNNGLVYAIFDAYNRHHALVLRPDDIWLCILSQFSLFINGPGRAEELRSKFVAHEGIESLVIYTNDIDYHTIAYDSIAKQMAGLIHTNVTDPTLHDWIMPSFTTTTPNDTVVASVLMMTTLQSYFHYRIRSRCGIPRVTLLGERADWEDILSRIEKLKEYGPETKAWYRMLQPALRRLVLAFDDGYAESNENLEFWQRVVHHDRQSGAEYLSGWITAFCAFGDDGKWMGGSLDQCDDDLTPNGLPVFNEPAEHSWSKPKDVLLLDGVSYHTIDIPKIPAAHAEVPVRLVIDDQLFEAAMLAGLFGTAVSDSGVGSGVQDQLSPVAGWFMFTLQMGRTGNTEQREAMRRGDYSSRMDLEWKE